MQDGFSCAPGLFTWGGSGVRSLPFLCLGAVLHDHRGRDWKKGRYYLEGAGRPSENLGGVGGDGYKDGGRGDSIKSHGEKG